MRTFFTFVISFAVNFAIAQINPQPILDSGWVKPYDPFRVVGNLYWVGTYDLSSYLITTKDGHFLINTGLEESVPMIRKNVEALGFKFNDIKILLTTQGHYDHVAGMSEIKKLTGAKMLVHEADSQVLSDGGKSDFLFGAQGSSFPPVAVDQVFQDGDTITLGEMSVVALHHPGHTKGSTSYMVNIRDDQRSWKVLIVNIPSILSQTRISGMPTYPNVGQDYARTFQSLQKLQFDLWLASHASQFKMHQKRKPGDPYRPQVFIDRPGFEASVNTIRHEYDRRLKEEKK